MAQQTTQAPSGKSRFSKASHTTVWIPVKDICVLWVQSQRPRDDNWALKIAEAFDPDLFGIITVTMPNKKGLHHVVDGQHRVEAVKLLFGDDEKVPCNVLQAEDPARAAQLFDKINSRRRKPQRIDMFRVRVTAGEPTEVAIDKLVRALGFKIDWAKREGNIAAVEALTSVYNKHGGDVLRAALNLIRSTWGMNPDAVVAPIIRGYGAFIAEHGLDTKWDRLVDRVSKKFMPAHLVNTAKALREAKQCLIEDAIKEVIFNAYNHGLRGNGRIAPLMQREAANTEAA
jgi:hypothetical protein